MTAYPTATLAAILFYLLKKVIYSYCLKKQNIVSD